MIKKTYLRLIFMLTFLMLILFNNNIIHVGANDDIDADKSDAFDRVDNIIDDILEDEDGEYDELVKLKIDDDSKGLDQKDYVTKNIAEIIVVNKITTKRKKYNIYVDQESKIGKDLFIKIRSCIKSTNKHNNSNYMFMDIMELKDEVSVKNINNRVDFASEEDYKKLFEGWVDSHNYSVSNLTHPIYEVIPIKCK